MESAPVSQGIKNSVHIFALLLMMDKNLYHFIIFFLGLVIYFFYLEKKELTNTLIGQDRVIEDLNKAINLQKEQIYYLNHYYGNRYSFPSLSPNPVH